MANDDVRLLVDTVHDLLDGPDGQGQHDYSFETERIVLSGDMRKWTSSDRRKWTL